MGAFWDAWNKQGQVNDQAAMSQIQQMGGLAGLMQKAQEQQRAQQVSALLNDPTVPPEQKRIGLVGLMRDPAQAANVMHQMETEKANAALRTSQMDTQKRLLEDAQRKAAQEARVQGASNQLGGLLAPQVSERDGADRIPFVGTEAQLVEHMKTAPGVYSLVNPAQVRSLQAIIDPKETAKGLLSTGKASQGLMNVGQGAKVFDPVSRQMVFENPAAPRAEPKITPYSDVGRIKQDVANQIITPEEGAAAVKALQAKRELTFDRGTVANAFKFRQEYTSNPEVKRANMLEASIGPVAEYIASVDKTGMNPTADLALVKTFLSVTHPKGDQISNMDRAEIGRLGNFGDRFGNSIESFLSGKNLPDQVRKDMWREVSNRYKAVSGQRNKLKSEILKRAESAKVPAELIFAED